MHVKIHTCRILPRVIEKLLYMLYTIAQPEDVVNVSIKGC